MAKMNMKTNADLTRYALVTTCCRRSATGDFAPVVDPLQYIYKPFTNRTGSSFIFTFGFCL